MSTRNKLKINRMKYKAKRYIFSGRYIVRNALAVMVVATVIAFVVVILNLSGKKNDADDKSMIGEADEITSEVSTVDPADQGETLMLYPASMIGEIQTEELKQVIAEEQQVKVARKDVQALTNAKYDMSGKFLTERDSVNIREEADEKAEIVGRLFAGATGEVVEAGDKWTKISSGGVTGYVATNLILTDEKATEKVENYLASFAVIRDRVRVRMYGNATSDVYFVASVGEYFIVDDDRSTDKWTCIRLPDGSYGFVSTEYVSITDGIMAEAISTQDIEDLKQAKADYQELLATEKKLIEDATKELEGKKYASKAIASSSSLTNPGAGDGDGSTNVTQRVVTTTTTDLYLLAAIVYAESGSECYDAQLAVANVVMNRVRSGVYPNTISEVIYQPYQFTACKTKNFANALKDGGSSTALRAAQEAMAGINNVGACIGFKFPNAVNRSKVTYCVQYGKILFFY